LDPAATPYPFLQWRWADQLGLYVFAAIVIFVILRLSPWPFPSQLFSYGFEHAAALEHAAGHRVDMQPLRRLDTTIFGLIDLSAFQDPNIKDLDVKSYDEDPLRSVGAKAAPLTWVTHYARAFLRILKSASPSSMK
jgi:hypothetical protein